MPVSVEAWRVAAIFASAFAGDHSNSMMITRSNCLRVGIEGSLYPVPRTRECRRYAACVEIMRGSGEMWFRVPRPLKRQIVDVAARFGQTQSVVVVRAIEHYFEHVLNLELPPKDEVLP